MIDYNASIIARLEHEERVRSLIPVRDYDDRLKDDRSLSIWPLRAGIAATPEDESEQPGVLYTLGSALVALGERIRDQQAYNAKSRSRNKNSSVMG